MRWQRAANPRRQRLCDGISHQPRAVRRPHPQHLRGCRRDPGAGRVSWAARRQELRQLQVACCLARRTGSSGLRAGIASSPVNSAKLICETRFTGSAGFALGFRYLERRLCHRNSPGVPPKLFRERCAWHGPDHASDYEERDPNSIQCRRRTSVPGDRFATRLWTGFQTERVTFRRLQIMREGRENTASNGPSGHEKACGTWARTRAGSLPA